MNLRTTVSATLLAGLTMGAVAAANLYEIPLKDIDDKATSLEKYKGKVILIVNVASKCGYTRQYKPLEATYREYKDQGLVVLGFPCNQFGAQEPGSPSEIKEFCESRFGVTFPLYAKIDVNGAKQHPLYTELTGENSPYPGPIKWNFNKFLVSRDGKIVARFDSKVEPDSPEMTKVIKGELAKKSS